MLRAEVKWVGVAGKRLAMIFVFLELTYACDFRTEERKRNNENFLVLSCKR